MRSRLFDGCIRTLKPGGILILQGYTPKQLEFGTGGPAKVEHLYTEKAFRLFRNDGYSGVEKL